MQSRVSGFLTEPRLVAHSIRSTTNCLHSFLYSTKEEGSQSFPKRCAAMTSLTRTVRSSPSSDVCQTPCCCLASPRWTILAFILFTLYDLVSLFLTSILSPTLLRCASLFLHVQSPPDCLLHVSLRIRTTAAAGIQFKQFPDLLGKP